MGFFKWLWERDRTKSFAKVGLQGGPVYINLPPNDPRRKRRALARIEVCKRNMKRFHPDSEHYKNFARELREKEVFLERYKKEEKKKWLG